MRKYFPRAQRCEDEIDIYPHQQSTVTVFEQEHGPRSTGLLDKYGNELMAIDEPAPCGFVVFERG